MIDEYIFREVKKQLKITNFLVWFLFIILIVQSVFIVLMVYDDFPEKMFSDSSVETKFEYWNLSQEEIRNIKETMEQVNPLFMYGQEEIIFTKERPPVCSNCAGANINKGQRIYIRYNANDKIFKKLITHELMHTYMLDEPENDWKHPLHQIVFELARQGVVFK